MAADENERLVLYRQMARAASLDDLAEIARTRCVIALDRFPTLVENLIAAMNLRRQMRQMLIVSALLKKDQLEIKFHPEAPLETQKLEALAHANRRMMRLTASYQVIVTLNISDDYEQLFTQIEGVLQVLAACEKLENGLSRAPGPLAN